MSDAATATYSSEQEQIALEILSKDKTNYYDILRVTRTAGDAEIKKAYRKLAIKLHPDKNPHPKASEAFKVINRAFEVLSDQDKRAIYDSTGRDPDSRDVPPAGAATASEFRRGQYAGGAGFPGSGFENIFFRGGYPAGGPPDDLFDILFGMGGPRGPFGGNPFFEGPGFMRTTTGGRSTTFTFGPGGFRAYRNFPRTAEQAERERRARARHDEEQKWNEIFKVMLPLLIFFFIGIFGKMLE